MLFQGEAKKPCLSDANGDKIGDTALSNSNDGNQVTNIQAHLVNNSQQLLDTADDYSVPTSPAKSEVRTFV